LNIPSVSLINFIVSILFTRYQTPFGNSRFVWDCKGSNLYVIRKFYFIFFAFLFPLLSLYFNNPNTLLNLSSNPPH